MDAFLFGVFPYLAVAVTVVGAFRRFRTMRYTVTTSSSQMLESRLQYWGSVSWHYAILLVLLAHLVAIFLPGLVTAALSSPGRLVAIEVTGLALGLTALWGLVRARHPALHAAWRDHLARLGGDGAPARAGRDRRLDVGDGALGLRLVPRRRHALARLAGPATPRAWTSWRTCPWPFKIHALNAFVLLALVPYTRLAHIFVAPIEYLWRLPQVVIWRRPRPTSPGGSR